MGVLPKAYYSVQGSGGGHSKSARTLLKFFEYIYNKNSNFLCVNQ